MANGQLSPQIRTIPFWAGFNADVDMNQIASLAIPVKGKQYHLPLRFLEIYANLPLDQSPPLPARDDELQWPAIQRTFMPQVPGITTYLGENIAQPPFKWQECDATTLCVNFTYNANAIYRIFSNLSEQNIITPDRIDTFVDRACLTLAQIYKASDHFVMRQMNNNFNMFLISKVVESIVGKKAYNSEFQEYEATQKGLLRAIDTAQGHKGLSIKDKMGIALAKGVTFVESQLTRKLSNLDLISIEEADYRYFQQDLAIDDRDILIDMIENSPGEKFSITAILDDTAETVDDLLWLQDLLVEYRKLHLCLLVNKAQISINFSSQMLSDVLRSSVFSDLASRINDQFTVVETYSPFISFQANFLDGMAKLAIARADVVYIKGANFFETCQIPEKDTFYGFVVYGPISRLYTGLNNFDAVFAYIPKGQTGYIHQKDRSNIRTLKDICTSRKYSSGGHRGSI